MTDNSSLAWSREKQLALLGHLISNPGFAAGAGSSVEPEWFGGETGLVKVRLLQVRFRERFNRFPTIDELREGPDMRSESEEIRSLVSTSIQMAMAATTRFPADALGEEVRYWHKDLLYRAGINRSYQLYKAGQTDEAHAEADQMLRRIREADRDRDHTHDWGNFRQMFAAREAEYSDALTLGHPWLDRKLMPESDSGSLMRGQSTIILSGTNRGKSRFLTTVVYNNYRRRKKVLWMIHEDPEIDVAMNFWCCALRLNRGQLMRFWSTPEGGALMDRLVPQMQELVKFAWMPPGRLTVEEVMDSVRRRQTDEIANTGRGFDMIVDDYPKKLRSSKAQGDFRHVLTYVYQQFIDIALEFNMHALLAYQTNREGHAATMEGGKKRICEQCRRNAVQNRWINETDCGEAWAPMENISNVISLNRDYEMEKQGLTVYHFCKTKASQAKGLSVACRGDYACAMTHDPELPATAFQAGYATADRLEEWLKGYPNATVPDEVIRAAAA